MCSPLRGYKASRTGDRRLDRNSSRGPQWSRKTQGRFLPHVSIRAEAYNPMRATLDKRHSGLGLPKKSCCRAGWSRMSLHCRFQPVRPESRQTRYHFQCPGKAGHAGCQKSRVPDGSLRWTQYSRQTLIRHSHKAPATLCRPEYPRFGICCSLRK